MLALALPLALVSSLASAAPVPVVAVFDIEDRTDTLDPKDREQLTAYLAAQVAEGGRFRVVPRAQLRTALAAQKQDSYRECFDEACQIEVGKELAAEKSLLTQVLRIGDQCVVSTTLYDLRSSATEQSANQRGSCAVSALLEALEVVVARVKPPRADEAAKAAVDRAAADKAAADRAAADRAAADRAAADRAAVDALAGTRDADASDAPSPAPAEAPPTEETPEPRGDHAVSVGVGAFLDPSDGEPLSSLNVGYTLRLTRALGLTVGLETVEGNTRRLMTTGPTRVADLGVELVLHGGGMFELHARVAPGVLLTEGYVSVCGRAAVVARLWLGDFFLDADVGGLADPDVAYVTSRLALGYAF